MAFKERMSRPEAGNPYYNRRANGGYSNAIKGSPTDSGCDVLHNCVGYAYGRFNEIGGYGSCKYLAPVNAENFMQYKGSCKTGMEPKVGACMVWQKGSTMSGSDGAGHVAIVERVVSPTQVITSESGWEASKPFWTQTRNKGNGNWGAGSGYTFLGFIYNPAVTDEDTKVTPTTGETVYTVQAGDTLSGIAVKYGTAYQKLAEYNGIPDPNNINVGQKIKIPSSKASSTTSGGQSTGQSTGASAGMSEIKAGRKVTLKNTPCYSSATVKQPFGTETGEFYLWDGQAISGRYRITNKPESVGKAGQVTCYIDTGALNGTVVSQPQAAPKVLTDADFNVGDKVIVNGPIYYGGNGGNSINKVSATMYVVGKVNAKAFKYCIGVAATKGGARQGWAAPGILKKG